MGVSCNFLCFVEIPVYNAYSVDPDQTPRSVASDLGLQCLLMSFLWDVRHKWAKFYRRHSALVEKYSVSLKTILQKDISEP